jgi:trimeric autotransporter adhesin
VGGYYRETQLSFPTGGPGVPLLSGTSLPQWGAQPGSTGVYALDLQTGNYGLALATEVTNSSSPNTGTSANLLAKIITGSNGGAETAATTDTTIPTYIVVSGNGTTGPAQLAIDGQATCYMDASVSAGSQGYYVVASQSSAGYCSAAYSALSSVPFGTWIVGQLITSSAISYPGGTGQILVHPGYRSLTNGVSSTSTLTSNYPIIGGGGKTLSVGTPSGSTTEFATVTGTPSTSNLASWDGSGNLKDSGIPTAVARNLYTEATSSGTTTNSNSGSAVNMFTGYTLPGSTLTAGHRIVAKACWKHSTGSTATTYQWTFGGSNAVQVGVGTSTATSVFCSTMEFVAIDGTHQQATSIGLSSSNVQPNQNANTATLSSNNAINITQAASGSTDVYTAYSLTIDLF